MWRISKCVTATASGLVGESSLYVWDPPYQLGRLPINFYQHSSWQDSKTLHFIHHAFFPVFRKKKNRQLNICLGSPCKHICCVEKTSTCIRQSNTCVWYSRAQTPTDGVSSQSDHIMLLKAEFKVCKISPPDGHTCISWQVGQLCLEFHWALYSHKVRWQKKCFLKLCKVFPIFFHLTFVTKFNQCVALFFRKLPKQ